jgi:hypothetical protein
LVVWWLKANGQNFLDIKGAADWWGESQVFPLP